MEWLVRFTKRFMYLGYDSNEQDNFASLYDHSKQPYLVTK